MFVATYTGGTPNLTTIATVLDASHQTIAAANASDYVIATPLTNFMLAAPAMLKASKAWEKFWPYHLSEEEPSTSDTKALMSDKEWSIREIT
ncbi:hypothetical protein ACQV2R_02005 [Facklamia sp. P12937]|uniref:hypothetical protein n=1 Tax=Facklamia sp. P12937 TaxID=3421949 RepID=UPI003D17AD6E